MTTDREGPMHDIELVQNCLEGSGHALESLQAAVSPGIRSALFSFGASETEVSEVLAGLWADCVVRRPSGPPLFERFTGRASLRTWLCVIATNRWISFKRREAREQRLAEGIAYTSRESTSIAREMGGTAETSVVQLLEPAVREAFAACSAEEIVILQLVHMYAISQREIATMWGCHESKVSRLIGDAEEKIARLTLEAVRKRDPWLQLEWQDFLELCHGLNLMIA